MTAREELPESRRTLPAPLAPEAQAMLHAAETGPPIRCGTPQAARAEQARASALRAPGPTVARVRDETIEGPGGPLGLRTYQPADPVAIIVYFHGGGWVIGSIDDSDAHVRRMALATNATIVSVGYRLAPEHPFPAAIDDAVAAWRWALSHRHELAPAGAPVAIAGESAGGNIAAGTAIALLEIGLPMPAFQILGYPITSSAMDSESYRHQADGPILSAADMRWFWDQYAPEHAQRTDPRASPLDAHSVAGLPPIFVMTAECDPLRDEGEAYAARLAAAGIEAECRRYPGMVHGFYKNADLLQGGRDALADVGAFVRRHATTPNGEQGYTDQALDWIEAR